MSKKSCFWRLFDKQHGGGAQTLFKSESHHIWNIYWSMWRQLNWKKFLLVISKMFGLFLNTLTAGHKFSLLNTDKLTQPIQMQLSKKKKLLLKFFLHFWNVDKILNTIKKKMTLIADVFPKLQIPKNVVR